MSDQFESALRAELAKKGVILEANGSLSLDPSFSGPDQPSQEQIDVYNRKQAPEALAVRWKIERQWAEDLVFTTERLLSCQTEDKGAHRAVLFLRLHGWLVDYPKWNKFALSALAEFEAEGGQPRNSPLHFFAPVRNALVAMKQAFTENELLYAEYRRHVDAHIHQSAYELGWTPKNGIRRYYVSRYTERSYDIDDLEQRLDEVVRRFGSEMAIAGDFAKRARPHALQLCAALDVFHSPQYR